MARKISQTPMSSLNINKAVVKSMEGSSFREIAKSDVSSIEGIGPKRAAALKGLSIDTVEDFGTWKYYRLAKAITKLAQTETDPVNENAALNIGKGVDKGFRDKSLQEIAQAPPSAMLGLAAHADDQLHLLNIKTIADLAHCEWAAYADSITTLAEFGADPIDGIETRRV